MKTFEEYKASVVETDDYKEVIEEARKEHNISVDADASLPYKDTDIPFNLEREYFDLLIDERRLEDAKRILDRMKASYMDEAAHNFIESFEYRLTMTTKTDNLMQEKLNEAKREFNQHTITLLSVVVGVITIFGVANQTLRADNFQDGLLTFIAIVLAINLLVLIALWANRKK